MNRPGKKICPSCDSPNRRSNHVCRKCGAAFAKSPVRDESFPWRRAIPRRPTLIVLLAVWLFLAAWIVEAVVLQIQMLPYWREFTSLILFWIGTASILISLDVLFTITKNYLASRKGKSESGAKINI